MSVIHISSQQDLDNMRTTIDVNSECIIKSEKKLIFKEKIVCCGTLRILSEVETLKTHEKQIYIACHKKIIVNSESNLFIKCFGGTNLIIEKCKNIQILLENLGENCDTIRISANEIDNLNINSNICFSHKINLDAENIKKLSIKTANSTNFNVIMNNTLAKILSYSDSSFAIRARGKSEIVSVLKNYSTQQISMDSTVKYDIFAFDTSTLKMGQALNKNVSINLYDHSRLCGNIKNMMDSSCEKQPSNIVYKSPDARIIQYGPAEKSSFIEKHNLQDKIVNDKIILYKRVSDDFKTQEYTSNETKWVIGEYIEHHNWDPKNSECGGGKFHACALPFLCDKYRYLPNDKYIAIEVDLKDIFDWQEEKNHPNKIAFRAGTVLYECDWLGNKIENVESEVAV